MLLTTLRELYEPLGLGNIRVTNKVTHDDKSSGSLSLNADETEEIGHVPSGDKIFQTSYRIYHRFAEKEEFKLPGTFLNEKLSVSFFELLANEKQSSRPDRRMLRRSSYLLRCRIAFVGSGEKVSEVRQYSDEDFASISSKSDSLESEPEHLQVVRGRVISPNPGDKVLSPQAAESIWAFTTLIAFPWLRQLAGLLNETNSEGLRAV